jgi:hypothetical protein
MVSHPESFMASVATNGGGFVAGKVFWTEAEKKLIASAALEIQQERPNLAGLSLLRQAIRKLPKIRQRKLISLSQAEWFEPALEIEARLRKAEEPIENEKVQMLKEGVQTYRTLNEEVASFNARYLKLNDDQLAILQGLLAIQTPWRSEHLEILRWWKDRMDKHIQWEERHYEIFETMRSDLLTICCLLKSLLQEVVILKHLAIGIPAISAPLPKGFSASKGASVMKGGFPAGEDKCVGAFCPSNETKTRSD